MNYLPAGPSAVSVEVQSAGPSHLMRRMPPHRHLFFEVLVCIDGNGTLFVQGREIALHPRTVVALPPGIEHDCRGLGTADGWSIIFLPDGGIDTETGFALDDRLPNDVPFDVFRPAVLETMRPIMLGEDAFNAALTLITSMERELGARPRGYDVMVRSALRMLLVILGRSAAASQDGLRERDRTTRSFLARVFAEIDEHYAEAGSLRAAAGRLDVQPGHLTTKVRLLTGRTYGTWVIERRMIEARRLLAGTDLSLAEIAECVGYAEIESFVRRFGKHHAMTPATWRRGARSESTARREDSASLELRSIGS